MVSHWIHEELKDIYIRNSGSAWHDETIGIPETKARAVTLETGIGAKTAAQSQEIPNGVMLVLPIS